MSGDLYFHPLRTDKKNIYSVITRLNEERRNSACAVVSESHKHTIKEAKEILDKYDNTQECYLYVLDRPGNSELINRTSMWHALASQYGVQSCVASQAFLTQRRDIDNDYKHNLYVNKMEQKVASRDHEIATTSTTKINTYYTNPINSLHDTIRRNQDTEFDFSSSEETKRKDIIDIPDPKKRKHDYVDVDSDSSYSDYSYSTSSSYLKKKSVKSKKLSKDVEEFLTEIMTKIRTSK